MDSGIASWNVKYWTTCLCMMFIGRRVNERFDRVVSLMVFRSNPWLLTRMCMGLCRARGLFFNDYVTDNFILWILDEPKKDKRKVCRESHTIVPKPLKSLGKQSVTLEDGMREGGLREDGRGISKIIQYPRGSQWSRQEDRWNNSSSFVRRDKKYRYRWKLYD